MAEKLTFILEDLAGGLNTQDHSTKIEDNQTPECQNVLPENAPSIKKRNGYAQVGGNIASADKRILGSYNFVKSDGVEYLMCVQDQTLYYLNSAGAWTSTGYASFTADKKCTFATYEDILYVANGAEKILSVAHNSAASPTAPTWTIAVISDGQCPIVELLAVHKNRLIGTKRVAATALKNRSWYSDWSDPTGWPDDDNNYDDIMPDDGAEVTGKAGLHDILYYFKKNFIYAQEGDFTSDVGDSIPGAGRAIRRIVRGVGASSHGSIQYYDNSLVFFGEKGVFAFDGSREHLLSKNIQRTLQDDVDRKNLDQAVGQIYKDRYYLSLPSGATKTVTSTVRSSNVVTVTTTTAHGYSVGDRIHIDGNTVGATDANGRFPVATVPSTTTFTYAQAGTGETKTGGTVNVYDNSLLYIYDFKSSSWWKYTGHYISCFTVKDGKLYGGDSRSVSGAGNMYQLETGTADPILVSKVIDDCETTWTNATDNTSEFKEGSTSQKLTSTDTTSYASLTTVDAALTFRPRGRNAADMSDGKSIVAFINTDGDVEVHRRKVDGTLDTGGNLGGPHDGLGHDSYDQKYPQVALLSNDDILITWEGKSTAGDNFVWFSMYTSAAWTTPVQVESIDKDAFDIAPSIAVESDTEYWISFNYWSSTSFILQVYTSTDSGATWASDTSSTDTATATESYTQSTGNIWGQFRRMAQPQGQSFTPTNTGTLNYIKWYTYKDGSPGNINVNIYATDGGGLPTGASLASVTVLASTISSDAWITAAFSSPPSLTGGTKYCYILSLASGNDGDYDWYTSNRYWIKESSDDEYAGGAPISSTDSGATWVTGGPNDKLFQYQTTYAPASSKGYSQIVVDNNDYVHVAWEGVDSSGSYLRYLRKTTSWQTKQLLHSTFRDFSLAVQEDNTINLALVHSSNNNTYYAVSADSGAAWGSFTEFNAGSGKTWQRIGLAFGSSKTDDGYLRNDYQMVATADDDKVYRCNYNPYKTEWAGWEQIGTIAADSFDFGMKWSYHNNNNPRSTLCMFDDGTSDRAEVRRIGNLSSTTSANKDSLTLDLTALSATAASTSSDLIYFWLYIPTYVNFQVFRLTIKEDDNNYAYIERTAADVPSTDASWKKFSIAKHFFTEVNDGSAMDWSAITELDFWTLSYGLACSVSVDDLKMIGDADSPIHAHWFSKSFDFNEPDRAKRMKKAFITATKQTSPIYIEALYTLDQKKVIQPVFVDVSDIAAATTTTVTKTAAGWTVDDYKNTFDVDGTSNYYLRFTSDTATVGLRDVEVKIASNTATVITIDGVFDSAPSTSDQFYIYEKQLIDTYKNDARLLVNKRLNMTGNCKYFGIEFHQHNADESFEVHNMALHYKLKKAKELE